MLVILIIAMTLMAVLGAAFVSMVSSKQQGFILLLNGHRANMIAKAGVEWAIRFASEGNDVSGDKNFVSGTPEEGSFSASYNDTTNVLTVNGTYKGITERITLSNFRRYLKIGDVSFPLSKMTSFKPVELQAGKSITVEPTGVIRLGQGVSGTSGAVWYGGDSAAGNCVNGSCDFGSGFRAYFVFQFAPGSTGDGFTFAIINGTDNTASSIGGDTQAAELMAYGGDSRLYSGGYINSFTDSSGNGLRPPKFAVEFDIYPNAGCPADPCSSNSRCDPSNEHMAYVFWGNDNRINCKDDYTRWMSSFLFRKNTVIYGTTGGNTYLYRLSDNLTTGTIQPTWPSGKGEIVTESGLQWQECSWRKSTPYNRNDIVAPASADGYFFRESASGNPLTGLSEPNWTDCDNSGTECVDNQARWQNAAFYGSPALFVHYATNSCTYDDNKHTAGAGTDAGNSTSGAGPTNRTSSDSYYASPTNPTKWLADRTDSFTVNRTYAYRMEVVRNSATGTYQIKSWIKTCDPTWSASTAYSINDQIRPTGNNEYYYTALTSGTSGTDQPTWPASGTVIDGSVTWAPMKIPSTWSASTAYSINDQIRPTVNKGYYYAARKAGTSGATEPTWPASGTVTDGTIAWVPIAMTVCNKYTDGTLGDVQSDYTATSPTLDRTITLDAIYNTAFSKFLFGWTTASGEAAQKADVWKFRMSFKP